MALRYYCLISPQAPYSAHTNCAYVHSRTVSCIENEVLVGPYYEFEKHRKYIVSFLQTGGSGGIHPINLNNMCISRAHEVLV